MNKNDILNWLKETDENRLKELWQMADNIRQQHVGDEVHLRGLIEFSNYCRRQCGYCGLNASNKDITRYRMTADEIVTCAHEADSYGYGTVVMQSGEDMGIKTEWLADVIRRIKSETPLAVTLSVGERPFEDYKIWREAGADRYLLRFETSDVALFEKIHPSVSGEKSDRFAILHYLRSLGYEIGSGVMLGIPGQTYESLAKDFLKFAELDLDMIGVGPYIPHPNTDLALEENNNPVSAQEQVPNTEAMTYKAVALTRIVCPEANIPSTTALATLNTAQGRELGLARGANVVMPNITPPEYRVFYEIYPSKACLQETAKQCHGCMQARILSIDREVGQGMGSRIRKSQF